MFTFVIGHNHLAFHRRASLTNLVIGSREILFSVNVVRVEEFCDAIPANSLLIYLLKKTEKKTF